MKRIPLHGMVSFYDEHHRPVLVRPWVHELHSWVGHAFFPEDGGKGVLIYYVPDERKTEVHIHRTEISITKRGQIKLTTDPDPQDDPKLDSVGWEW